MVGAQARTSLTAPPFPSAEVSSKGCPLATAALELTGASAAEAAKAATSPVTVETFLEVAATGVSTRAEAATATLAGASAVAAVAAVAAGPAADTAAAAAAAVEGDRWERRDGGREACGMLSPWRAPENEGIGVGPCVAATSVEPWSMSNPTVTFDCVIQFVRDCSATLPYPPEVALQVCNSGVMLQGKMTALPGCCATFSCASPAVPTRRDSSFCQPSKATSPPGCYGCICFEPRPQPRCMPCPRAALPLPSAHLPRRRPRLAAPPLSLHAPAPTLR